MFFQLSDVTDSDQLNIEEVTRAQSACKAWVEFRSMRITASHFGSICKATEARNIDTLCASIISPKPIFSKALEHGKKYEAVGIAKYEEKMNTRTQKCGLFISVDHPYLGASPDGLVGGDTVVEVKCPCTNRAKKIDCTTVPFLHMENGKLKLKTNHDHYYQIRGQLYCTKRSMGHLVVYTFKDVKIIEVPFDKSFIETMVTQLKQFYAEHFRQAMLDKYLYKHYHKYSFEY